MAGGLPTGQEVARGVAVVATATSTGIAITNTNTANAKQAWVQLSSSTPEDADWIEISLFQLVNFAHYIVVDIGIGASGSQQVIINNLVNFPIQGGGCNHYKFPCNIPAGTDLWARCAFDNANSTDVIYVAVELYPSGISETFPGGPVDSYGVTFSGSPYSSTLTGSTSDNTESSWLSLGTLSTDILGFCVHLDGTPTTYNGPVFSWLIDIGVGASGSQVELISDMHVIEGYSTNGYANVTPNTLGFFPISIPSGTNIWVRGQLKDLLASGSTPRVLGVAFYGVEV